MADSLKQGIPILQQQPAMAASAAKENAWSEMRDVREKSI